MKKTLITLLALAGVAAAADSITLSTPGSNYNTYMWGFRLNLSADLLTNSTGIEMKDEVVLNSLSLHGSQNNNTNGTTYALLVLDSSNRVLGYSDANTKQNNAGNAFTFQSTSGAPLTLSSTETYDYMFVSGDVTSRISGSGASPYYYTASTGDVTVSGTTISGGALNMSLRGVHGSATDDCAIFTDVNKTTSTTLAPYVRGISVTNVPEPATATLSLLALAALAARRRRK